MEADTFKNKDRVSSWAANDSPKQVPSQSRTDEKEGSSLGLNWINSTVCIIAQGFCKQQCAGKRCSPTRGHGPDSSFSGCKATQLHSQF